MPHPERAEPVEADEEERVARQKAELGALADERRAAPYSPLDFAERITDVERGGPTETVERTAQWIERAALDQYGQSPYVGAKKYVTDPKTGKKKLQRVSNQEIAEHVSPKMVDDILWQLEQEHNGSDWYKKDLKYVREQLPKIYPEMKENPSLQKLFWMLLPPTSYGANPKTNFSAAHNVYRYFTRTGVLSPYQPFSKMVAGKEVEGQKGWTSRAKPVAANITALNRLRERFKSESDPEGFDGAFHWLEQKHSVKELVEVRGGKELNAATETYPRKGKSPVAYGAMIFGRQLFPQLDGEHGTAYGGHVVHAVLGTLHGEGDRNRLRRGDQERQDGTRDDPATRVAQSRDGAPRGRPCGEPAARDARGDQDCQPRGVEGDGA
jgi:hypothetical protein